MNAALDLQVRRPLRDVSDTEIGMCPTFHSALNATVNGSGLQDKSVAIEADIDPAQLSKMLSGQAGIQADKLFRLMDACGSELPLFWLLWKRGYDPASLRRHESDVERENRELREQLAKERAEKKVIAEFIRETRIAT